MGAMGAASRQDVMGTGDSQEVRVQGREFEEAQFRVDMLCVEALKGLGWCTRVRDYVCGMWESHFVLLQGTTTWQEQLAGY